MTKYLFIIIIIASGCNRTHTILEGHSQIISYENVKEVSQNKFNWTLDDLQGNWFCTNDSLCEINITNRIWTASNCRDHKSRTRKFKIEFDNNKLSADDTDGVGSPCIILDNNECIRMFEVLELSSTKFLLKHIPSGELALYRRII